jgi:hypothetical protein
VGNIASGSSISTTGNVSGGNVSSTGSIVATGVITGLAFNGILDGGNATSF